MRLKCLWEVYGPNGRFDDEGNFVPTEKFGIIPSIFMNVVILPIAAVHFAFFLSLEFLPRRVMNLIERQPRRGAEFQPTNWRKESSEPLLF